VLPRTDDKEALMNYSLAYRIGFHPWEDAEEQPTFIDKFSALLDREERGRQPPYGPLPMSARMLEHLPDLKS
jgi:hypothetical protein